MMISTVSSFSPLMATARVASPSKNHDTQRSGIKLLLPLSPNYQLLKPLSSKSTEDLMPKLAIQSAIVNLKEALRSKMEPEQFSLLNDTELHPDEKTPFEILNNLYSWLELMGCDEEHINEAESILSTYNAQVRVPAKAPWRETAKQVIQILKEDLVPLGFILPKKPLSRKVKKKPQWMTWTIQDPAIPTLSSSPSSPYYETNAPIIKELTDAFVHRYGFEEYVPNVDDYADATPELAYKMTPQLYLGEGEEYEATDGELLHPKILEIVDKIDSLIRRKED
jgi:hypothetical protein